MKKVIVIPAYNEQATIDGVIREAIKHSDLTIVVNDNSSDDTQSVVERHSVELLNNQDNLGYDKSLAIGIKHAIKQGATSILTIDADGQHPTDSINSFFQKIEIDGYDLVLGSRQCYPRFSEMLFGIYTRVRWNIQDLTCGMKCYSAKRLKELHKISSSYNSVGTYLASQLIKAGRSYTSLSINESDRSGNSRFGNSFKSELTIIGALLRTF